MCGRMKLHLVTNPFTLESFIMGAKQRYTSAEYEAARQNAERGDPDAIAILDDIREGAELDPQRWHENCPECQAERARGGRPPVVIKPKRWPNRPRWRTMKRAAGTR
jgi:hypothetical protein